MDSCHFFNFLFSSKGASSELRKCFSAFNDKNSTPSKRNQANSSHQEPESPMKSPLRHIKTKIFRLTSKHSQPNNQIVNDIDKPNEVAKSFEPEENQSSNESPDSKLQEEISGTYRATLVESLSFDDSNESKDMQYSPSQNHHADMTSLNIIDQTETPGDPMQSLGSNFDTEAADLNSNQAAQACSLRPKRLILYSNVEQADADKRICSSAEIFSIVSSRDMDDSEPTNNFRCADFAQRRKRSFVRDMILSFESDGGFDKSSLEDTELVNGKVETHLEPSSQRIKPCSLVKPLPPKTLPKSIRAKCLNVQLTSNKPVRLDQLFQDTKFLARLFDHLDPLDRCSAAQVCQTWRKLLYSDVSYWRGLMMVIDYSKLRREHTIECIWNTLQAARLRQQLNTDSNRHYISPRRINNKSDIELARFEPLSNGTTDKFIPRNSDDLTLCSQDFSFSDPPIDLDEVWRIQEVCNRHTENPSANADRSQSANNLRMAIQDSQRPRDANQRSDHLTTSESASIPSQISSTISSASLSSLQWPVSDFSRMDSIKEKLYASLDQRGFDAICLFAATNDDLRDLTSKLPAATRSHIKRVQLRNCFITDESLQVFFENFPRIQELELILCNSLTDELKIDALSCIKHLTIQDCINISDEFAESLDTIMPSLESLNIHAYHLSDFFPDYLASRCRDGNKLKQLGFPNCKNITNRWLGNFVKYYNSLESLSVAGTKVNIDTFSIYLPVSFH